MPTTRNRPVPAGLPVPAGRPVPAGSAAALTLTAGVVGAWALAAPASFYRGFPLSGHRRVAGAHDNLVRDVGAPYLALGVLSAWAALRPDAGRARPAGAAWLVYSVPHLLFHLGHLGGFDLEDAAGNVLALGGTAFLAAVLVAVPDRALEGSRA